MPEGSQTHTDGPIYTIHGSTSGSATKLKYGKTCHNSICREHGTI